MTGTDSKGYLVDEEGFDYDKIALLREIKTQQRSLRFVLMDVYFESVYQIAVYSFIVTFSLIVFTCDMCRDYSKTYARAKYYDEAKPWNERCDVAFPCATQNEIDQSDAMNLVNSGCRILVEGSIYWWHAYLLYIFFCFDIH